MRSAFWLAFASAFSVSALIIGSVGGGLAWLLVRPNPEHFATSAFSFDLPEGWACQRDGTEYTCSTGKKPNDAIVVLAIKMRNAADTLDVYESTIRSMPGQSDRKGARLISLRRKIILGSPWIEGVLLGSEIANYETTYLAGNTADLGILVTFSHHVAAGAARARDLRKMMDSIVINQHEL